MNIIFSILDYLSGVFNTSSALREEVFNIMSQSKACHTVKEFHLRRIPEYTQGQLLELRSTIIAMESK